MDEGIEAQWTRAKVADQERATEHRDVLHEHRFLELERRRITRQPEVVHHERNGDEKNDEQARSQARLKADEHAQPAHQRDDAGQRYQEASQRNTVAARCLDGVLTEVAGRSHDEEDRKQLSSRKPNVSHETPPSAVDTGAPIHMPDKAALEDAQSMTNLSTFMVLLSGVDVVCVDEDAPVTFW
jgi:hypothetical protein